jgi:uncharacterized membrane protein
VSREIMSGAADQDNRLRKFASFFKGYMGVMPLVTAAFAPLLTMAKAIPVFESQKTTLATYSGLLGFLLLAWVFYVRGAFVKAMVPRAAKSTGSAGFSTSRKMQRWAANLLPLLLIVCSVFCYLKYFSVLDESIGYAREKTLHKDLVSPHDILEKWGQLEPIFLSSTLQSYYLGIFLFAEMAFVVMALREYAYGVLKVPEAEILGGALPPP